MKQREQEKIVWIAKMEAITAFGALPVGSNRRNEGGQAYLSSTRIGTGFHGGFGLRYADSLDRIWCIFFQVWSEM